MKAIIPIDNTPITKVFFVRNVISGVPAHKFDIDLNFSLILNDICWPPAVPWTVYKTRWFPDGN